MLLPTCLVGSTRSRIGLIDRASLAKQMPPRVRRASCGASRPTQLEAAQDDATLLAIHDAGARRPRHHHRRRAAARELFQPLRHRARRRRHRQSRQDAEPHRRLCHRAAHRRADPAPASGRGARRRSSCAPTPSRMIKMTVPGPFTMAQQCEDQFYRDEEALALDYAAARQCRDQGPVRRRRRRGAARRAVAAGAAREGAPIRPQGARPRARRRGRHDRGASVLRLCADGEDKAVRLFVPARAGALGGAADFDRGGAAEARSRGASGSCRRRPSCSACSTCPTSTIETRETVACPHPGGAAVRPAERIVVAPDCGLKYLPREIAFGKMQRDGGRCRDRAAGTRDQLSERGNHAPHQAAVPRRSRRQPAALRRAQGRARPSASAARSAPTRSRRSRTARSRR